MTELRLIAALGLLVLMAWAAVRLLRSRRQTGDTLRVVRYHGMGPRRGIAAVRVYDRILVVGVTPQSISLLESFSAAVESESFVSRENGTAVEGRDDG